MLRRVVWQARSSSVIAGPGRAESIHCKDLIGMPFDTFGPIEIDHAAAQQAFAVQDRSLTLMEAGATLEK